MNMHKLVPSSERLVEQTMDIQEQEKADECP